MRLALRELRRRPGRFATATAALAAIVILILLLWGLLDGLYLGSTGAIRAQDAKVFVYSATARDSFLRSRITPEQRATVEQVPGVTEVGGVGIVLVGAQVPGESEPANVAVIGYERAPRGVPDPPPPGEAWADRRLRADGVRVGQQLLLGIGKVPIVVKGFVSDTSYLLNGALWVEPGTWRAVQDASRPDARVGEDVFQVLVVDGEGSPSSLAASIDAATAGATKSLTKDQAVLSIPGTKEQKATFNAIVLVTFGVAVLVVALFFALLTLERAGLYGVLKAIGASSGQLFGGLVTQAVVVALVGTTIGALVTVLLGLLLTTVAPTIPLELLPSRVVLTALVMVPVAVLGGALSLRRVVRIDPASAIGSAS